jgi:hypothetical protein
MSGNHNAIDESSVEEWLFNDAPRALRIESVEKLPDLFESLVKEADAATKQIKSKTQHAQQLVTALGEPGPQPGASRKTEVGTFPMMRQRNE